MSSDAEDDEPKASAVSQTQPDVANYITGKTLLYIQILKKIVELLD
jgi:hypothetical protein